MPEPQKPQADRIEEMLYDCRRELRSIRSLMPVIAFLLLLVALGIFWGCVITMQRVF